MRVNLTSPLVAVCGINCGVCIAFQRKENKCTGCNSDPLKTHCLICPIKNCATLKEHNYNSCSQCSSFPCFRINDLDKRYRIKYGLSIIDNLNRIKEEGIHNFIKEEKVRWTCARCGETLSVHKNFCQNCGAERANFTDENEIQESLIIRRIAEKKFSKEQIAADVLHNPVLLYEVLRGLRHKKADVKHGCDKVLRILSEQNPALLYPHINFFLSQLNNENNLFKWSAISIVANLSAVDINNKIDDVIDAYLLPVKGPVMITANNTIKGAAIIAGNKPYLADKITSAILKVKTAKYQTKECRYIAAGTAIDALDEIFHLIKGKKSVLNFVKLFTSAPRPAVKKRAKQFLLRHSVPAI